MPEQQKVAKDFAMSEILLILVLHLKTNKTLNDEAKVQIKSEKLTPFRGIFSIMEIFDALIAQTISFHLGIEMHIVWLSI